MRALLLSAGLGTRLRPLTDSCPKCLVKIHGKPLLAYWLDLLFSANFERVVINTHYLSEQVSKYICASPYRDRISLVHEEELLGTGGTVLANETLFPDASFLVAHADNLTRFEVNNFVRSHALRPPGVCMTMMTFETDAPQSCGIVELDSYGVVRAFHEKSPNPPGRMANAAVYIFDREIFSILHRFGQRKIDLSTEVLPKLLGRMATWHNSTYHRDIGTPESLLAAQKEFSWVL